MNTVLFTNDIAKQAILSDLERAHNAIARAKRWEAKCDTFIAEFAETDPNTAAYYRDSKDAEAERRVYFEQRLPQLQYELERYAH